MSKSEEISDVLTKKAIADFKTGQVLMFNKDGKRLELKITRIDRKNSRVWAKRTDTFTEEEVADKVKRVEKLAIPRLKKYIRKLVGRRKK